jgi:hypothetical protein
MGKARISASKAEVELFRKAFEKELKPEVITTKPLEIPLNCKSLDELLVLPRFIEPITIEEARKTFPFKKDE